MAQFTEARPAFAGSRPGALAGADAVVWGIPTDCGAGTGRLGAKRGPRAVREASNIWNTVRTSSGFQFPDHGRVVDLGDVRLAGAGRAETVRRIIAAAPPVEPGRLNVMLGGDHSVTRPVLESATGRWGLIYMDAHPDCIDAYGGDRHPSPKLRRSPKPSGEGDRDSHACVLRRLVESGRVDPRRTVVLGMRAPEAEEVEWLAKHRVEAITCWQIEKRGIEAACRRAMQVAGGGRVYLSVDMDTLEAASVPGVENPEPGGVTAREALWAMDFFGGRVDAADLVEVSGEADPAGITAKTAARMLLDLIGAHIQAKSRKGRRAK